jgi:hypothetical protein
LSRSKTVTEWPCRASIIATESPMSGACEIFALVVAKRLVVV